MNGMVHGTQAPAKGPLFAFGVPKLQRVKSIYDLQSCFQERPGFQRSTLEVIRGSFRLRNGLGPDASVPEVADHLTNARRRLRCRSSRSTPTPATTSSSYFNGPLKLNSGAS